MLIRILECLNQTECFINRSANRQIVDSNLPQVLLSIDDEQTAEGNSRFLLQDTIGASGCHRFVGQQRIFNVAETAVFAGRVDPGQMSEMRIGRDTDHLAVDIAEFLHPVRESDYFRRTYKCTANGKVYVIEKVISLALAVKIFKGIVKSYLEISHVAVMQVQRN